VQQVGIYCSRPGPVHRHGVRARRSMLL